MAPLLIQVLLSLGRILVAMLTGYLLGKNLATPEQAADLTEKLTQLLPFIVTAVVVIIAAVWSRLKLWLNLEEKKKEVAVKEVQLEAKSQQLAAAHEVIHDKKNEIVKLQVENVTGKPNGQ